MLSPQDDLIGHQAPAVFARAAGGDPRFTERYWYTAHPVDGSEIILDVGMGYYPNRGVMDAFAGVTVVSFFIPSVQPLELKLARTWRDIFGLEALELLRDRDHRVVFLTAALYNAPLAAFYPYTPVHLQAVGIQHSTAAMTLGQLTETVAMLSLAKLLVRIRLKWLFLIGIGAGVIRYALFALNTKTWMLVGISLHGIAYALYFITAQIYVESRVEPRLRARAQALLALMISGVGNLSGFIGSGVWREYCETAGLVNWSSFWAGLSICSALVFVFFATSYQGQRHLVARP